MPTEVARRRFTVAEYNRMLETGILREGERVELVGGEILEMSAMGARHASLVSTLAEQLVVLLGRRARVRTQLPLHLDRFSEPEPDLAIVARRPGAYAEAHPRARDVLWLIEVSDTTLGYDRDVKRPLYAIAGINELWIVDLAAGRLEVCRDPTGDAYRSVSISPLGEPVTPQAFPDVRVRITPHGTEE